MVFLDYCKKTKGIRIMADLDIIVPVYNGGRFITSFIRCFLIAQNRTKKLIRLILVDNGSVDDTRELILEHAKKNHRINYYSFDQKVGSYAARNFGVKKSDSNLILFTDIDCEIEPNFFNEVFALKIRDDSFYGGRIRIRICDRSNPWEILDSGSAMQNQRLIFATACLLMSRKVFDSVGFFLETTSGGDFEWNAIAKKTGFSPIYTPQLLIQHPSRKSFTEFKTKYTRIAYGVATTRFGKGMIPFILGLLLFLCKIVLLPKCRNNFKAVRLGRYVAFRTKFIWLRIVQTFIYVTAPFMVKKIERFRS